MASPKSQTTTSTVSSSCQCGQCGEIISACRLEDRPASRDPQFHTGLCRHYIDTASLLLLGSAGEKENGSRRRSEESLYKYWKKLDLLESEARPFRILPRWAQKDGVLRQIQGKPPANETLAQMLARYRKEYRKNRSYYDEPLPGVSAPSNSSFTSYGSATPDTRLFDPPESPLSYEEPSAFLTNHKTVKASNPSSVATLDLKEPASVSCAHTEEHMRSSENILGDRYEMSSRFNDHIFAQRTDHEPSNADSHTLSSSGRSPSEFSSLLTPLSSDMVRIEKLSSRCTRPDMCPPDLRQGALSRISKTTLFELEYSNKSNIIRSLFNIQEVHRGVERNKDTVSDESRIEVSTTEFPEMQSEQANMEKQTTLKRKRDMENAFPFESGSTSIDSTLAPMLRPRKRVSYKT